MATTRTEHTYDPVTQKTTERVVTSYAGRVFAVYHRDYRAMSDVYTRGTFASIIELDGSLKEVLVNANFELDLSKGYAESDALPEMLFLKKMHEDMLEIEFQRIAETNANIAKEHELNKPVVGKRMAW